MTKRNKIQVFSLYIIIIPNLIIIKYDFPPFLFHLHDSVTMYIFLFSK